MGRVDAVGRLDPIRAGICAAIGGLLILLVLVALLFDWNWVRPPLERYISQKTQREFRMDDLHVRLGFMPTIRMRGWTLRLNDAVMKLASAGRRTLSWPRVSLVENLNRMSRGCLARP